MWTIKYVGEWYSYFGVHVIFILYGLIYLAKTYMDEIDLAVSNLILKNWVYFLIDPVKYETFISHSISKKRTNLVACIVSVMHEICKGLKNSTILPKPNKSIPRLVSVKSGYWRWVPVMLQCYIGLAGPGSIAFDKFRNSSTALQDIPIEHPIETPPISS